ncbi:hypothetical protein BC832DRAFT_161576 [Gaertneriomyces semiglobifer]|nr:hypothetical protein BC832DRAFT_161576 [Gaertneriomyces semiglobifer]
MTVTSASLPSGHRYFHGTLVQRRLGTKARRHVVICSPRTTADVAVLQDLLKSHVLQQLRNSNSIDALDKANEKEDFIVLGHLAAAAMAESSLMIIGTGARTFLHFGSVEAIHDEQDHATACTLSLLTATKEYKFYADTSTDYTMWMLGMREAFRTRNTAETVIGRNSTTLSRTSTALPRTSFDRFSGNHRVNPTRTFSMDSLNMSAGAMSDTEHYKPPVPAKIDTGVDRRFEDSSDVESPGVTDSLARKFTNLWKGGPARNSRQQAPDRPSRGSSVDDAPSEGRSRSLTRFFRRSSSNLAGHDDEDDVGERGRSATRARSRSKSRSRSRSSSLTRLFTLVPTIRMPRSQSLASMFRKAAKDEQPGPKATPQSWQQKADLNKDRRRVRMAVNEDDD